MSTEYDRHLSRLRYVKKGDWVLAEDHNAKVDCLKAAKVWLLNICKRYNIDPRYVYELDPYLEKLRYVKAGDTILSTDHNNIVDTLKKLREVLEKVEELVYHEGYREGYNFYYEKAIATIMFLSSEFRIKAIYDEAYTE